jgi:hypothetical protein
MIFSDGEKYRGNFQVYLLTAGNLEGSIVLTEFSTDIDKRFDSIEKFAIIGELTDQTKLVAENCIMYSLSPYSLSQHSSNFSIYIARFIPNSIKIFDEEKIKNLDKDEVDMSFHIGILNYYSINEFSTQTEIGTIQMKNLLSQDDIIIFRKSSIPFISAVLELRIANNQKSFEVIRDQVIKVASKILELTSFALAAEHSWAYFKVYLDNPVSSTFVYSEINKTLPRIPDSHENVDPSNLGDFISRSWKNYNEETNLKYNFSLALKWYLDSLSVRYDVMKYISASIAFESILDAAIKDEGFILEKTRFR